MNYNELKLLIAKKKFTIRAICEKICMTESGFHLAVRNDTLKVRDLEKIVEILGVPISQFFEQYDSEDAQRKTAMQAEAEAKQQAAREAVVELKARLEECRGQVEYFRKLYVEAVKEK